MSFEDSLYSPRYPSPKVCSAVGVPLDKMKHLVFRKPSVILLTEAERAAAEPGGAFLWSFQRALQFALTVKLNRMGLQTRHAALIAAGFTDVGNDAWDGPEPTVERLPCHLFKEGQTLLVAYEGSTEGHAICWRPAQTLATALLTRSHQGRSEDAIVVHVDPIFHRLRAALES
ncbi:MAG TPA: hypothetical protein VNZ61_16585 [Roseomonas sp.]|nr:hypothetical protein [Roseomonas sp.]